MDLDPRLGIALAAIIIVAALVIVITSGESVAVRFLTMLVALDVGARLVTRSRRTTATNTD